MNRSNPHKFVIPDDQVACGGILRLYPTEEQVQPLFQAFGNCRFVFNQLKATFDERYKNNPDLKIPNAKRLELILPCLKREYPFLKLSDATSLQITVDVWQQAQMDYITRKTKNQGKPKFKGKNYYRQSYTIKNGKTHRKGSITLPTIRIIDATHINLPKIGEIKTSNTTSLRNYRILRATITWRQDLDRFYISFNGLKPRPRKRKKTYKAIVIEYNKVNGENATNKYSSYNWQKSRKTKSKYGIKMHYVRFDQVCKVVKYLIDNYDVIVIEDLKVKNLMKNHHLAKSIANASWYLFRKVLKYECDWYGKKLIVVPPQYTSRICSACGQRNPNFTGMKTNKWLAVREWNCPFCHAHHDRDINAAINILNRGIRQAC